MNTKKTVKSIIFTADKGIKMRMIAPCGINCALCMAHLRRKKQCSGCRQMDPNMPESCRVCIIRTCKNIKHSKSGYCYECSDYPCKRMKNLEKLYRKKYGVSIIGNLEFLKLHGKKKFIKKEKEKWMCSECGNLLCMHRPFCITCAAQNPWIGEYNEKAD